MSFYTDVIQRDPRFNSPAECRDPMLLEPHFRQVIADIIADAARRGLTLEHGETFRSEARQEWLFAKGLTQIREVGVHHFGLACDLLLIRGGRYDPVGAHYVFLEKLCAAHPCPWGPTISGIDWGEPNQPHSFRDWDHVQCCTIDQQPALFSGQWYPNVP